MGRFTFSEPVDPDETCMHCGQHIVAVAQITYPLEVAGISEYEWQHRDTGDQQCAPKPPPTARPYDGWTATRKVRAAERARQAAIDATDAALAEILGDGS